MGDEVEHMDIFQGASSLTACEAHRSTPEQEGTAWEVLPRESRRTETMIMPGDGMHGQGTT
jgi:hypothetical protein